MQSQTKGLENIARDPYSCEARLSRLPPFKECLLGQVNGPSKGSGLVGGLLEF